MAQIQDMNKDWSTFVSDFSKAEEEHLACLQLYRQTTSKQDSCAKNVKHLKYVLKQLKNDIQGFEKKKDLAEGDSQDLERKRAQLMQITTKIAEMERELPAHDNGIYLSIILGSNLNVSLLNPDERYRYKQEYESFKLSVTCVILALFLLSYWLPPYFRALDALCNFLLVWYYCTLTIRESILRVNGSRIKGWWVLHHYISCVLCGIMLTWRGDRFYEMLRPTFIFLVCYIGSVQIIQYKYQTGCLRRLHALGQRHSMDITVEGFSSWMFKGLTFLLPFLIGGYVCRIIQAYCAYFLFHVYFLLGCTDWQVFALGVLFAVITVGNSVTIAIVIWKKFAEKNRADVAQLASKYRPKTL